MEDRQDGVASTKLTYDNVRIHSDAGALFSSQILRNYPLSELRIGEFRVSVFSVTCGLESFTFLKLFRG